MSNNAYLVLNAGSSSLKFSVFNEGAKGALQVVLTGQIEGIGTKPTFAAKNAEKKVVGDYAWADPHTDRSALLSYLLDFLAKQLPDTKIAAAGHRVVHGGTKFNQPVLLTPAVIDELESLVPLAPLHQPNNVAVIRALAKSDPALKQVACFDTAFHQTQPKVAYTYGLPRAMLNEGIRRYGFHGLSYEYIASRLPDVAPKAKRAVVAHLGSGASISALVDGKCVDTSLGFSTLEGVPMGTRPGDLDPGILIYLMREKGMDADKLEKLLYKESGLLGVSGISNDMRALLDSHTEEAEEAIELFCYRAAKIIAAFGSAMGGIDTLVFTAGIGEHSAPVRARICQKLEWLGVVFDADANKAKAAKISKPESKIEVFIIPTDEELMIARSIQTVLAGK